MHLRKCINKKRGKTYVYYQLVESFRRPDGMPATRIVKHLGKLPEYMAEGIKLAIKANRENQALFLESELADVIEGGTKQNLRYLDLAVLSDCWSQLGVADIMEELMPPSEALLTPTQAVLPLILQRCCVPRSKLQSTRWVPTTALPELLHFEETSFNNSRVHRTLESLFSIMEPLQQRLSESYERRDGATSALFMDVTDTYFEGIGCPTAELTRTKSKMPNKRCIGIVMLVNERGYPMRWKVVGGKTKDWHAMEGMLRDIGEVSWLGETLIVFDRAMGNRSTVTNLKEMGTYFLTAAHADSINSYTDQLSAEPFQNIEIEGTDESYKRDIERVRKAARNAGFEEINDFLFAIDLGICTPLYDQRTSPSSKSKARRRRGRPNGVAKQLRRARKIQQQLQDNPQLSRVVVATAHGLSTSRIAQLLVLTRLAPKIQERIEQLGDSFPLSEKQTAALARREVGQQTAAFEELLTQSATPATTKKAQPLIGPLRLVAYFNPRLFVDIRRRTEKHCRDIQRSVQEINRELANAKCSRKRDATYRKFSRLLERYNYMKAFDIDLEELVLNSENGKAIHSFCGQITRKDDNWQLRREHDGFVLLLGHPDLPHSGAELVQAYRDKDIVEKGFESIKSLIKIMPVYHYKDPKVQAHVTICMLAMLLLRFIRNRLHGANLPMSAATAIDTLMTCHLNKRTIADEVAIFDITEPTEEQEKILDALGLEKLCDYNHMRPNLRYRQ